MSALVTRWEVRDPAKLRDFGLAALQVCRANRGRPEVADSGYYFATSSQIVIVTDFKPGLEPTFGNENETWQRRGGSPDACGKLGDRALARRTHGQ